MMLDDLTRERRSQRNKGICDSGEAEVKVHCPSVLSGGNMVERSLTDAELMDAYDIKVVV